MPIARVTLEIGIRKELDYRIPEEWRDQVRVGSRVKVPFGSRQVMGSVTALVDESPYPNLKPLSKVIGRDPLLTPNVLRLARWMADYYCCPLELVLKSLLPESVRREKAGWRQQLYVRVNPQASESPSLTKRQREILQILEQWRELPLQELVKLADTTTPTVRRLEDHGMVTIQRRVAERDPYGSEEILPTQPLPLSAEQQSGLDQVTAVLDAAPSAPLAEDQAPDRSLQGDRMISTTAATGPDPLPLFPEGSDAPAAESSSSDRDLEDGPDREFGSGERTARSAGTGASRTFLLHGVTGSGKTEVYLQAIERALVLGRGAIVLVPEISLTPQTVERFKARFGTGPNRTHVAVLHSQLSSGERHDEWHKIRQGRARIVIGARSAIFAPVEPLGLIIVDEEHEPSYKQEEAPRYHARDVAVVRGRLEGAVVVLGSATPSLESYGNARKGKYRLIEMPSRVDGRRMPLVRVVDLRLESRKQKGPRIFSVKLKEAILQRLEKREQTMLFLNRRGYAASLQCPHCGYVPGCPNCSVSLTYHRQAERLACHICGHEDPAVSLCPNPQCTRAPLRYIGLGTEKVESTLQSLFPQARVQRMDSDTLKRKSDYRRILSEFRVGKIDILIGTQMIAKGLHFPNVTLVGIVYADLGLHIPDFRAGERTFQLLTQVAGRAGRGDVEGEVFVQAFTPFHPAVQHARRHDYVGFYEEEVESRAQLNYPPCGRVALLTLKGQNEEKVRFSAEYLKGRLDGVGEAIPDCMVAGPAPAPLVKAETYYRYHLMLRTRRMSRLSRYLGDTIAGFRLPEGVTLAVDIDPVNLA